MPISNKEFIMDLGFRINIESWITILATTGIGNFF